MFRRICGVWSMSIRDRKMVTLYCSTGKKRVDESGVGDDLTLDSRHDFGVQMPLPFNGAKKVVHLASSAISFVKNILANFRQSRDANHTSLATTLGRFRGRCVVLQ